MKLHQVEPFNCRCGLAKSTHHHEKRQDNPIDPFDLIVEHQWVPLADEEDVRCIRCDVRYGSTEVCI